MKRHLTRIPKEDLVIVLNSENDDFVDEAKAWCTEQGVEHYVTVSDGTPSTGKNSVLDLFCASDNDYMGLVDGDDFITPHGLVVYDKIAQMDTPPDAVALEYQYGIVPNEGYSQALFVVAEGLGSSRRQALDKCNQDHIHGHGMRVFIHPKEWWDKTLAGTSVKVWDDFTQQCSDAHKELYSYEYKYINQWETHLRITFYSKKAASQYRFDPELIVGEDTMQYFQLKNAWVDGDIELKHFHEVYPTYVYDQRINGIVKWANEREDGRGWLKWMKKLNHAFETYETEGKMHTVIPERMELEFDEGYRPDTLGLVNYPCRQIKY